MSLSSIVEITVFILLVIGFIFENKIAALEEKIFLKIKDVIQK